MHVCIQYSLLIYSVFSRMKFFLIDLSVYYFFISYIFDDNMERTVCLFGEFDALSLVPLIVARGIRNIYVFTSEHHDETLFRSLSAFSKKNFGKYLHIVQSADILDAVHGLNKQGMNRFCDALYLKYNSDEDAHNLLTIFSNYFEQRSNVLHDRGYQHQLPIDVVWVRRFLSAPDASTYSHALLGDYLDTHDVRWSHPLLQWHMNSVWVKHSRLEMVIDSNGYSNKIYGIDDDTSHLLSEVRLGAIGSKNPDITAPETAQCYQAMIIVITYSSRVFADNAFALKDALEQLSYSMVYVVGDLSVAEITRLRNLSDSLRGFLLQIAMAADIPTMLTENYVLYHMEQRWSDALSGSFLHRYRVIVRRAMSIWTFSSSIVDYFLAKNYSSFVIPIYSGATKNESFLQSISFDSSPWDSDVLFFGSCSARRVTLLTYLSDEYFRTRNILRFLFCCGGWPEAKFDVERDMMVLRSKIVYNIHTNNDSVLEVHRINYLLSLGKCVISEKGPNDVELDMEYADAVIFVDSIDEMYNVSEYLFLHPAERADCEERSVRKYQQIASNLTPLKSAMDYIVSKIASNRLTFSE